MRRILASIQSLALVGLIVLTSVAFGVARGQAGSTHTLVICTGHGVVSITVDANGEEIERAVLCPDCVVTLLAWGGDPPAWNGDRVAGKAHGAVYRARGAGFVQVGLPMVRAPPAAL